MKKNLIFRLFLPMVLFTLFHSCIHDETLASSDPASKEYTNKSLWKEDEKYIKNVMKIYQDNEFEIKKNSGTPYWDYATTVDRYDESFLMVPVVENGKVVSVLQVPRHQDKVYFIYTSSDDDISFFQNLFSSKLKKVIDTKTNDEASKLVCTTKVYSVWYPDNESNPDPSSGSGHWGTYHVTNCTFSQAEACLGIVGPNGECLEGGGGGYNYPIGGGSNNNPPDLPNPCDKLKTQTSNITFKNSITFLEGKTTDSYESGYRIGTNSDGSLQNQLLQNRPGTQQVDLKAFSNTITLMHSHYDGLYPMFSPGDIIFFNQWIVWAQNWNSVPKNMPKIPLNNLTFTLVTSNGNYSFIFDGTSATPLPNYTQQQLEDLDRDYSYKYLNNAVTVGNVSGSVNFNMEKLETEFLKFMNDKMKMDGLQLYKTTTSGNSSVTLVNGILQKTDCPN
ncbi:hypothetical protein [Chryseobacterium sp. HR92]|uniref:hypothetical protein n=1 Tax=Chryseobacterium sp. HR92 TaxID=3094839 RepID=UPI0038902B86|nr:hypothetical protein SFA27_01965 [Chryseobacterium sp. HR92]